MLAVRACKDVYPFEVSYRGFSSMVLFLGSIAPISTVRGVKKYYNQAQISTFLYSSEQILALDTFALVGQHPVTGSLLRVPRVEYIQRLFLKRNTKLTQLGDSVKILFFGNVLLNILFNPLALPEVQISITVVELVHPHFCILFSLTKLIQKVLCIPYHGVLLVHD